MLLSISHISLVGKEDGELGRSASVSRSPPFCKNGGKQFRRMVNVGLEIMCFGSLSQFYNFFFFQFCELIPATERSAIYSDVDSQPQ